MALLPDMRRFLADKFGEELKFFKGWMDNSKAVGSILPTSAITARRMASIIDIPSKRPVLELGPGTGVITRAILDKGIPPEQIYSIEYSEDFVEHLREEFSGVHIIHGDALNLDVALGENAGLKFDCVISALPLLFFPMATRIALVEDLLTRLPAGRPMMQITYGAKSPVRTGDGNFSVKHYDFIFRNAPPANLWIYQRND